MADFEAVDREQLLANLNTPKALTHGTIKDETGTFKLIDGKLHWRHYPIKGADMATFVVYETHAKDKKHVYLSNSFLKDANPATFKALNYCYYKDDQHVWSIAGKLKDVDAASFEVCDAGQAFISGKKLGDHGYGKDKNSVFYYNFDGTPNIVKKADAASFVSLNDGWFGVDKQFAFFEGFTLAKANITSWQKLGGYYSADKKRVYFLHKELTQVDYASFEVHAETHYGFLHLAKDAKRFYDGFREVSQEKFEERIAIYEEIRKRAD